VVFASVAEITSDADVEPVDVGTAKGAGGGAGIKNIQAPKTTIEATIKIIIRFC
jgi:hypothetical protein